MDRLERVLRTTGKGLLRGISCKVTNRAQDKSAEQTEEESQEVAELVAKHCTNQKMDLALEIAAVKLARLHDGDLCYVERTQVSRGLAGFYTS